jgi:transcription initiation factor TFIIIB Brf1 subunit/transcription initiation factor TFIIB
MSESQFVHEGNYISYTGNKIKYENSQEDFISRANILKDLEDLQIPFDVKCEASNIFRKLNIRTRGQRRKKILYYCLFFAYRKLNNVKDPKEICKLLGIKGVSTNKDFFYKFYEHLSKEDIEELKLNEEVKPEDFFDTILEKLSEESIFLNSFCIEEVQHLLENIKDKKKNIEEEFSPKIIACGIFLHYLHTKGMYIDTKTYTDYLDCSKIVLERFLNQILDVI